MTLQKIVLPSVSWIVSQLSDGLLNPADPPSSKSVTKIIADFTDSRSSGGNGVGSGIGVLVGDKGGAGDGA